MPPTTLWVSRSVWKCSPLLSLSSKFGKKEEGSSAHGEGGLKSWKERPPRTSPPRMSAALSVSMVTAHAGPRPMYGCSRPLGRSGLVSNGHRSMSCGEKPALGSSNEGRRTCPELVLVIGLPKMLPETVVVELTVCDGTGSEK